MFSNFWTMGLDVSEDSDSDVIEENDHNTDSEKMDIECVEEEIFTKMYLNG